MILNGRNWVGVPGGLPAALAAERFLSLRSAGRATGFLGGHSTPAPAGVMFGKQVAVYQCVFFAVLLVAYLVPGLWFCVKVCGVVCFLCMVTRRLTTEVFTQLGKTPVSAKDKAVLITGMPPTFLPELYFRGRCSANAVRSVFWQTELRLQLGSTKPSPLPPRRWTRRSFSPSFWFYWG